MTPSKQPVSPTELCHYAVLGPLLALLLAGCPVGDEGKDPRGAGTTLSVTAAQVGDRRLLEGTEADGRGDAGRPNILMIAFDNVRADRMSSYGGPRPTTPNLDALAARGTRFAHAIAQAPYTPHSFSSLFSSLYVADLPVRTRARARNRKPVDRAGLEGYHVTLAEALADAGYVTAALLQGWFTDAFGLTQGYEWSSYKRRGVTEATTDAVRWLSAWKERGSKRPFFFLHYTFDVHYRFMAGRKPEDHFFGGDPEGFNYASPILRQYRRGEIQPDPDELDNALTLCDEGLYWADRELAPLFTALEELSVANDTIVIFVSDHGEEFEEHGYLSHGQSNFRSVTHVPLIIYDPRQSAARSRVVETPVMNLDIMPTLLDLAGVRIPETVKGLSLAPSIVGLAQPELENRYLFSEGAWNGFVGAVTVGRYTFLLDDDGKPHLYDWSSDPEEQDNLVASMPELARHLEEVLFLHKREGLATQLLLALGGRVELDRLGLPVPQGLEPGAVGVFAGPGSVLSEQSERQLRALGYLQ